MELIVKQKIPVSIDEAWAFFSSPANLNKLTPTDMKFVITSGSDYEKAYPGMIITYKVSPIFNVDMHWMTEISQVKELVYFVDDQRSGPFKIWHHQHHFKEISGGVEMTDILHYKIPFGFLGKLAGLVFVNKRVRQIFDYRRKALLDIFGTMDTNLHGS